MTTRAASLLKLGDFVSFESRARSGRKTRRLGTVYAIVPPNRNPNQVLAAMGSIRRVRVQGWIRGHRSFVVRVSTKLLVWPRLSALEAVAPVGDEAPPPAPPTSAGIIKITSNRAALEKLARNVMGAFVCSCVIDDLPAGSACPCAGAGRGTFGCWNCEARSALDHD